MEKAVIKAAEQPSGSVAREGKNAEPDSPVFDLAPALGPTHARPRRKTPAAGGAPSDPSPPPHPILKLQQTIGNRAVGRLLRPPAIQLKHRLRGPADPYEREADRAAEAVSNGGVFDPALAAALSVSRLEATAPLVQRASADGGDAPEPPALADTLATPFIVNDDVEQPSPGQMNRTAFLTQLETAVSHTVSEALAGSGRSSKDCPYLDFWFAWAERQSSAKIERGIRIFAPETKGVRRAADYIPPIGVRLAKSVATWLKTGKVTGVPKEAAGPTHSQAQDSAAAGAIQTKSRAGGARSADPAEIQSQLDGGSPLNGTLQSRMQSAFAYDFSGVRIHTGSKAADLAEGLNARAFTIAGDVAFGAGEYQPGTPAGDALIAHELAHVVQQGGGSPSAPPMRKSGPASSALERDADNAAAGAVASLWGGGARKWADLSLNAMPRLRSGLSLQRCGSEIDLKIPPPKYEDVIKDLKDLYQKKQQILAGQAQAGDQEVIDTQIDADIALLRLLGITLDEDKIFERVLAGTDLRVIEGSIERIPATPAYFGQRLQFVVHTAYLPPDRKAKVEWRWKAKDKEYQFLAMPHGYSFTLDESFWTIFIPPEIQAAKGFEVLARIYLGDDKTAAATVRTGWIALQDKVPANLEIDAAQAVAAPGTPVRFKPKDWAAPGQGNYSIDWEVDGKRVAEDFFVFTHAFDTTGIHKVTAKVYRVRRSFGIREKDLLREASTTIEIQDPVVLGTTALAESAKLTTPPALSTMDESIHASMHEIAAHAGMGGPQKAYWEERYHAQEKQLQQIGEQVPDFKQTKNLPSDPANLAPGAYATPIPAVIVYPTRGGIQPVKAYLIVRGDGSNWTAYLIDITGSKVLKFPESSGSKPLETIDGAFGNWKSDNPYHTGGTVVFTYNPPGWKRSNNFSTYAVGKRVSEYVDGILEVGGIVVGLTLLAAPDDPLTKMLGYAILALSVARSGYAIYQNLKLGGELLDKENIIEGLSILTALLGIGGGWMRTLGAEVRNVRPLLFRLGNVAVVTSVAGDLGTLIYANDEALAQLRAIQGDPTMDDGQRSAEMTRVISGLFLSAALVIVSNKDLFKGGFAKGDFIKERIGEGQTKISQGTRLDLELELRKQGADPAELRKLPDGELVDRHFKLQQRLQATATLAKIKEKLSGAALEEFNRMAGEFSRPEEFAAVIERESDPKAFLEKRAAERKAAEKKAADEKKTADEQAAKEKKPQPTAPATVAKPLRHGEWIDRLRKLDPSSDIKLAPARALGEPIEGVAQVAPESQIRINDQIDIHPERLDEIAEADLQKLLTATRELKAKGGDFSKLDATQQKALNSLGSSGTYRLRFEFQRQRADKFLAELGVADRPIFQNLPDAARNRIFDLISRIQTPDPSKTLTGQIAPKGAPDVPRQAADYALSRKPGSAAEFVNHYEFYLKQFEVRAEKSIAAYNEKVSEAIAAWETKNGTASPSQRSRIEAEVAKKAGVTGSPKSFYNAEQQKQMQAAADKPGVVSEEARKSVGDVYNKLVTEIGGRVGGSRIEGNLPRDQVVQKLRSLSDIQFGSESAAAYHTEKHFDEIPTAERTGSRYEAYIESARKTIQDPSSTVTPTSTQEGGANSFKFERKVEGGRTMQAFVVVTSDGKVILATYMGPVK